MDMGFKEEEVVITDSFQLEKYGDCMLARFNELRAKGMLFDLHLIVDGMTFPGHKPLLACTSDYFLAMCDSGLIPASNTVELKGITPHALEKLLDFIYTGYIKLTELDVEEILRGSSLLLIKDVQNRCCKLLETLMNCNNALGIWRIADELSCQRLTKASLSFVSDNFIDVCEGDEFVLLSTDHLKILLESDKISVKSEDQVYNAVCRWVDHDNEVRNTIFPQLLTRIRLPYLSEKVFANLETKHSILRMSIEHCIMLKDARETREKITKDGPPTGIDNLTPIWLRPRQCMTEIEAVIAVGGVNALVYAEEADQWYSFSEVKTRHCPGMTTIDGELFVFGGSREWKRLNTGSKFSATRNVWMSETEVMQHHRSNFGLVELQGCLYAVGGFDGKGAVSSVECYNPKLNKWKFVASLSHKRDGSCIAADGQCIYAITGYDGDHYLKTIECYDLLNDTWSSEGFQEIPEVRENASSVIVDGCMYIFGGYHDDVYLSSCLRYSIDDNKWDSIASMSNARYQSGAAVLNRCIYICGGWTAGGGNASDMVERYAIDTDSWTQMCSLPTPCTMRCATLMFPRKLLMKLKRDKSNQEHEKQIEEHRRNAINVTS